MIMTGGGRGYGAHMTRHPSRAVVYVPVPGPDARPYLLTCAHACERGGCCVGACTGQPSGAQRMLDRREVDVIAVADVEHQRLARSVSPVRVKRLAPLPGCLSSCTTCKRLAP